MPARAEGGFGKNYLAPEFRRDWTTARVKMAGTVYLQCGWLGDQWGETAWCQGVADETSKRDDGIVNAAIISQCDLLQPYEQVEKEIKEHLRFKNFRGWLSG
jgi:predicted TIM-barrel fold metal-dependent hydrolase